MTEKTTKFTTKEVAEILGISVQRVFHKIGQGHFPNLRKCECGRTTLIPLDDLISNKKNPADY